MSVTGGVRVLTLNLWGLQGAWDERRAILADGLRGLRPDVVSFQEAIVGDGYDQVADLLGRGYHVAHGPSHQLGYEFERERQSLAAARLVEGLVGRLGTRHVVVAGDFNADPDADSVALWCGRRSLEGTSVCYRDAWEDARPGEAGHTFTPTNPRVAENKRALDRGRRIDYVFVRCEYSLYGPTLDVRACTLAFDEPVRGVWASDHFGVVAELSVPDVYF